MFYCSFLLTLNMFFVLNCSLGKPCALWFIDHYLATFLDHQCFLSIYFKNKASFFISSNKRPRRLFHFKALKCSTYWREALILKWEKFFISSKICSFLFPNKNTPVGIYMFKVNNRNTTTRGEICSKLTRKRPERRQWRRSGVFLVNFEHFSHLVLVFLLLTLRK